MFLVHLMPKINWPCGSQVICFTPTLSSVSLKGEVTPDGIPAHIPASPPPSKICQKAPVASADGVHHRNLPGDLSAKLGSRIGHFSQVNHQMIAASQAGSRGEVKGGEGSCGRFGRVRSAPWDAPLTCLMQPCLHVPTPP